MKMVLQHIAYCSNILVTSQKFAHVILLKILLIINAMYTTTKLIFRLSEAVGIASSSIYNKFMSLHQLTEVFLWVLTFDKKLKSK